MASPALNPEQQQSLANFQKTVIGPSQSKLVILDFFAEWCGPCKQLTPVLKEVAEQYADRGVLLVMVDVDKDEFVSQMFQIRAMPTVYAIVKGKPVANLTQARTISAVSALLDKLLEDHNIVAA